MTAKDENKVELFGPYEIYERLGVGGMATVYRAKKQGIEGFERVVALKRMLSHLADDESFIKSFVREARLASQLQHANIIQIYDLGRVGRVYYIAMEFVRGHDLRKILKQTAYATGPMPLAMMLTITRQLCDALDYAHSLTDESGEPLGIVHRDISPSNLLIAADGHLKIIDFGIAKATTSSLRTMSGRVKGKFAYMAPESIQGKQLDNRSDIFSVGIVAYEMLTARPLFAAKNQFETIRKITQETVPPPSHYNPQCPPDLDDIVLTALAKTPEERWQSAGAMHRALDHVAKRHGFQATNREIAEWVDWAFQQPLQSNRVPAVDSPPPEQAEDTPPKRPTLQSTGRVDVDNLDPASIEVVWGGSKGGPGKRESGSQSTSQSNDDGTASALASSERTPALPPVPPVSPATGPRPAMALPDSGMDEAVPEVGNAGISQPNVIGHRSSDASQPYARVITPSALSVPGDEREPRRLSALQQASNDQSGPVAAGQSTVLGVAPPPSHPWKPAREGSGAVWMPTEDARASARGAFPMAELAPHGTAKVAAPPGRRARKPQRSALTLVLQLTLLIIVCAGAAVGGYILVRGWPSSKEQPADPPANQIDEQTQPPAPDTAAGTSSTAPASPAQPAAAVHALPASAQQSPSTGDAGNAATTATAAASGDAGVDKPGAAASAGEPAPEHGTPLRVTADKVTKQSGKTPRVSRAQLHDANGKPVIARAELCMDDAGKVTSVKILAAPEDVHRKVREALATWRYQPFELEGKPVAVCFETETGLRDE